MHSSNPIPSAFQALQVGLIPLLASPGVSCSRSHSSELPCRGSEPPKPAAAAASPFGYFGANILRIRSEQTQPATSRDFGCLIAGCLGRLWALCGTGQGTPENQPLSSPLQVGQEGSREGTEALAGSRTAKLAAFPSRSSGKDIPASVPPAKHRAPGTPGSDSLAPEGQENAGTHTPHLTTVSSQKIHLGLYAGTKRENKEPGCLNRGETALPRWHRAVPSTRKGQCPPCPSRAGPAGREGKGLGISSPLETEPRHRCSRK